jgi:hypothetical protein
MDEIAAINLAYHHKPFNSSSLQHKQFLQSMVEKTNILQQKHAYLDLEKELSFFKQGISGSDEL